MTLKQAQKLYDDSVQAKMTHADYCMTQSQLEYIVELCGDSPQTNKQRCYSPK